MTVHRFAAVADDFDDLPAGSGHTGQEALDDLYEALVELVDCGHAEPGAYAVTVYSGVRWHGPCDDEFCDACASVEDHYGRPMPSIGRWRDSRQTTITVDATS